jgi:hypothetical protein
VVLWPTARYHGTERYDERTHELGGVHETEDTKKEAGMLTQGGQGGRPAPLPSR